MLIATPRVDPVKPPYPPELQAVFDQIMPLGMAPLTLFTTLARVPRIYERFRAGGLLDRGPVSLRHREILIDRTCARCGCWYEWSVHVALFGKRVELTPDQNYSIVYGSSSDAVWSAEERLLIRVTDELHESSDISDALWSELKLQFSTDQIFEMIALVGFYRTVSYFANSFRLPRESFAAPPPEKIG